MAPETNGDSDYGLENTTFVCLVSPLRPPSLPPVSFKNILNAIPTRQFQKKTVKERNLLR